ncbi:MAG: type 2 isopentenyl-diphosphate Delta-isomerase [Candidatus Marinimicrobia bacterium]|nr:type 2 isopentenyl-diphosphate Delta-isomerase [Candidatus Neomarinimicrobiota bacterium]MCF7851127.1 type 2 isopentenyl-diphosphate Delta-isomerase [Candidatus Neomarinimicrobiota bacterium]MCF7904044.1 type 2 isopentenyl-diphosphate Delta-isomerase [Candidatus Neomarinimicrobiota bacterium]
MTKDISQRKKDHLKLAQDDSLGFNISAGFENWRFIHNALPELDLKDVDTSTTFLNKTLRFPLLISSMTGGTDEARSFNSLLAEAAEHMGCALGLGSIRPALEDDSTRSSFLIAREMAPDAIILANLGIGQVISGQYLLNTINFCEDLQADGLIIHLNPLQEAFQLNGDTDFSGGLKAIETWVQNFPLPIIVKEVGQGLSPQVIDRLADIGVQYVDIAGAGGSNWISIEGARLPDGQLLMKHTAKAFEDWGLPTVDVLENLDTDLFVIASGGLKRPLDLAKALALGAQLGGIAGAVLKPAGAGDLHGTLTLLETWQQTLKIAMFGTGIKNISELVGNRTILDRMKPATRQQSEKGQS